MLLSLISSPTNLLVVTMVVFRHRYHANQCRHRIHARSSSFHILSPKVLDNRNARIIRSKSAWIPHSRTSSRRKSITRNDDPARRGARRSISSDMENKPFDAASSHILRLPTPMPHRASFRHHDGHPRKRVHQLPCGVISRRRYLAPAFKRRLPRRNASSRKPEISTTFRPSSPVVRIWNQCQRA